MFAHFRMESLFQDRKNALGGLDAANLCTQLQTVVFVWLVRHWGLLVLPLIVGIEASDQYASAIATPKIGKDCKRTTKAAPGMLTDLEENIIPSIEICTTFQCSTVRALNPIGWHPAILPVHRSVSV